ncbi:hypothetical protein NDU88_004358 [Pleurodeles waltl]|uniref:Uncharacterized protein n=1 Tax=Pleurodeles waltl TaxID=8319 RepID=A0AAV7UIV8_PLEWA|nr:hypothetical protein NDU88_004358 [Pleurodeles waltl]
MPRRATALTPSEIKSKGKNQATITTFLTGGAQDSLSVHITPSSESNVLGKEPILSSTSDKKLCIENKELFIKTTQDTDNLLKIEDSNRETSEKTLGLPGSRQPQTQRLDQIEQLEYQIKEETATMSGPTVEKDNLHNPLGSPKRWDKMTGKDSQLFDWGKYSSDKFYSLTEESELSSIDRSFSESEESETSGAGNISPSNELTVRQHRQRKPVKMRPGSQEGFENVTSMGGRTLKWDYSGIALSETPTISRALSMVKWKQIRELLLVVRMRRATRQGSCSQYIAQLKSCKQRLGSKAGVQGLLQRDCRGRSVRLRNHVQKSKLSYAQWKKG